ncbi:MAG: ABC transporter permease [Candidatus Tectimicrobiota bacterium]
MATYIVRRLVQGVLILFLLSLMLFALVRSVPRDTMLRQLAQAAALSPEELASAQQELGLERPFWPQYATWLGRLLQGDLGHSLTSKQPVRQELGTRLPLTLHLACLAFLLAVLLAMPLGLLAAVWPDTVSDYLGRLFALIGLVCPDFWLGTLAVTVLALWWRWTPPAGFVPLWDEPWRCLSQLLLPAVIIAWRLTAVLMRLTRTVLLEVLSADYIRTARAKGLQAWGIVFKHGCSNAWPALLPLISRQCPVLLGSALLIEVIFALPGVGSLTLDAAMLRDYTLLQGSVLCCAGAMVGVRLLAEISAACLDPRWRWR